MCILPPRSGLAPIGRPPLALVKTLRGSRSPPPPLPAPLPPGKQQPDGAKTVQACLPGSTS